jgi:type II secretory pathway component PulF
MVLERWSVNSQERVVMLRSLSTMFASGLTLDRSIEILARQQANPKFGQALDQISSRIREGRFLSNALANYPWLFSETQVTLVSVGEKTGSLQKVLGMLATLEERQTNLQMKLKNSLVMPLLISSLCVVMVAVAPPLLFKPLFELMKGSGAQLSWPSQLLLLFSDCIRSPISYAALFCLGLMLLNVYRLYLVNAEFRARVYGWLRRVPALGATLRLVSLTRFCQTLEATLSVGLPLLASLKLSGRSTGDPVFEKDVNWLAEAVKDGCSMCHSMEGLASFPRSFAQSIGAAEESGSLTDMLSTLGGLYQIELDSNIEVLMKLIEPLMLMLIGAIVCFTIVATMLPMLKLVETL